MLPLKPNTVFTPQGILVSVPSVIIDTSFFQSLSIYKYEVFHQCNSMSAY